MPTQSTIFAIRSGKSNGERHIYPLTVSCVQEGKRWVATCLELGTSAYAPKFEKAVDEVREAILLHLNESARLGFIDEYLRQHGVTELKLPIAGKSSGSGEWSLTPAGA